MIALLLTLAMTGSSELAFAEAERLAVEGNASAAVAAYEDLLAAGHDTPGVRYNLGTLYLEAGDPGRAMLHLTAAARFVQDADVDHNLEVVRRMRRDRVEGRTRASLTNRVGRALSPERVAWIFLACFALFSISSAIAAQRRRWLLALPGLVFLLIGGLLLGARIASDRESHAVVLSSTEARVAPTESSRSSFTAHEGLAGVIIKEENGYARLRLDNGLEAWLRLEALGTVRGLLE